MSDETRTNRKLENLGKVEGNVVFFFFVGGGGGGV
jgi:hypothetical protein